MKLKRFVASDSAKAMRMIKDAFGPDAVILSSHSVEDGVEVVAAVDYDESIINQQQAVEVVDKHTIAGNDASFPVISPLDEMKQEIQTLRNMLETQITSVSNGYSPLHQLLNQRLLQLGFSTTTAAHLLKTVASNLNQEQAWEKLLQKIQDSLIIYPGKRIEESGVYAFVGATGVGKTTTIAKLAARFSLRYGSKHLGLITTDAYRIAAHEQLLTYGKILGVNVCLAEDETSLHLSLQKLADKKLILIDTAGMNPLDTRVAQQMETLSQQKRISTVFMMSATSHFQVLNQAIKVYSNYGIQQSIITKLDEAYGVGGVISAHLESGIPLSYLTNGQRVPEDIKLAVKKNLIVKLIDEDKSLRGLSNADRLTNLSPKGEYNAR